jgi:hypothetical protein
MNILDQIFSTITSDGKLALDKTVADFANLHPLAQNILTKSFQKGKIIFIEEDLLLLLSELPTASRETLISIARCESLSNIDYRPEFEPLLDVIINENLRKPGIICQYRRYGLNYHWIDALYNKGDKSNCTINYYLSKGLFNEITKSDLNNEIVFRNREAIEWLIDNRPEFKISKIFDCNGAVIAIKISNKVYFRYAGTRFKQEAYKFFSEITLNDPNFVKYSFWD